MAMIVYILNFFVSLLNPRWNIYAYLHHGTFQKLKNVNLAPCWRRICCCCKCWSNMEEKEEEKDTTSEADLMAGAGVEEEDANGIVGNRERTGKEKNRACKASTYFLSMTRREVFLWHLSGLLSAFRCACCKKP